MGYSLAYQVQIREAKLLSDIFVLFLRDSSYCQGVLCKPKFSMFWGTLLHFSVRKYTIFLLPWFHRQVT